MFDNSLKYHIFKDYNKPFDEKGTTVGTIRKVQWVKNDNDIDESKAKLEIRKIYTSGAEERLSTGYKFSTEEGPSELTEAMLELGYGNTKNVLNIVRKREDFVESINNIDNTDDSDNNELFDMRDLLLSIHIEDKDIEEE